MQSALKRICIYWTGFEFAWRPWLGLLFTAKRLTDLNRMYAMGIEGVLLA